MSKSRALLVIARDSTFTYKGRAAAKPGVRYVFEGSMRKAGSQSALDSLARLAASPSTACHIVIGDRTPDQNYRQLGSPRSKLREVFRRPDDMVERDFLSRSSGR